MKILFIAPLKRAVTPRITASRPRVIFDLVSGLIKRGHKITILGTGDSLVPGAKIIPVIPRSFLKLGPFENSFYAETSLLAKQVKIAEKISKNFDIVHNHGYPEFLPLLASQNIKKPIITTIHAAGFRELDQTFSLFKNVYFVAVSKAARSSFKRTKIYKVIYHGVDTKLYKFSAKKEDWLFWLGRLSRARNKKGRFLDPKGALWAIKLARATGSKLYLSGNVEDKTFFEKDIKPFLNKNIKWLGPASPEQPLTKTQVASLMAKAKAFLMTINWAEPFGLVMAEAQACGTPVIGFGRGSVQELVLDGKTGFIVKPKHGLAGLAQALKNINKIKPEDCRANAEKNFSLEKMVENYEKTYRQILQER